MEIILAVDVGSSSVKVLAYAICSHGHEPVENGVMALEDEYDDNKTGSTVEFIPGAQASRNMRATSAQTGKITDLHEILKGAEDCVTEVLDFLKESLAQVDYTIKSVGFSSFCMNLVGVDAFGEPIGEQATISYACNTNEVVSEVELIKRTHDPQELDQLYRRTGAPIHSAYAIPQLRVLYETQSELCDDIELWQSISNLLIARWTGTSLQSIPLSYSEASWTGLLNFRTCTYETMALALLPCDRCRQALVPMLCDFDEFVISGLSPNYVSKWPKLGQASFFLGLGDGACANIGSKCCVPTRIACTIGTSAAARVCVPLPILPNPDPPLVRTTFSLEVPNGLFCYRIDKYHVLLGGALTDGGSVVEWLCQLLRLDEPGAFEQCMIKVAASVSRAEEKSHAENEKQKSKQPLTMIPFLSGERSTGHRGGATGVLYGITRDTTATDLIQSSLEGVTLRLGAIVKRIQAIGLPSAWAMNGEDPASTQPLIILSGKGLEANKVWRQMISNCTSLDVLWDKASHGATTRGVAILVHSRDGESTTRGMLPLETLRVEPALRFAPHPKSTVYWKQLEEQQESLLSAVSPLYAQKH